MRQVISSLILDRRPLPRGVLIGISIVFLIGVALLIKDEAQAPLLVAAGVFGSAAAVLLLSRPLLAMLIAMYFRELHYSDPVSGITLIIQPIANGALLLALFAWVLNAYVQKTQVIWNGIYISLTFFILWAGVTLLWAGDFDVGSEHLRRYTVGLLTVFLMLQNVKDLASLDALMRLLAILGWSMIVLGVHAIFFTDFQLGDRLKIDGFNENEMGSMLILFLPGCIWPVIRSTDHKKAAAIAFCLLYILFVLVIVLLSGSRGSTLSLGLTLAALCFWKPLRFWGLAGGGTALAVLLTSAPFLLESLTKRFDDADNELGKRDVLWDGSMRLIADYPLGGIGVGNGALELPKYAGMTLVNRSDMPPHNVLFEVAIETGLIGLTLYLIVCGVAFYQFFVCRSLAQNPASPDSRFPEGYFPVVFAVAIGYFAALLKDGGADQPGLFLLIALLVIPTHFARSLPNQTAAASRKDSRN